MKLTNRRKLGRYINPHTGRAVNVWKARKDGGSDVLFYLYRGCPQPITDADFYSGNWKKKPDFQVIGKVQR